MKDLSIVVQSCVGSRVLIVTDFRIHVVAEEILKTIKLLQRYDPDQYELFEPDINQTFGLDIKNNHFHMILWENWIRFMDDLDLIQVGTRWGNGTHEIFANEEDIKYLENLIKNEK